MLRVPHAPAELLLPIERQWNGEPPPAPRLRAFAALALTPAHLQIRGGFPAFAASARVPAAPPFTRVANLWEYDVVEVFLAGSPRERYVEIEIGAAGHFLVLSFDGVRRRAEEHTELRPELTSVRTDNGWETSILLPRELLPRELTALNAFAVAGGAFLAHQPHPGDRPDFHQPNAFVEAAW